MRATHRGTRKNITLVGVQNDIATYSVESYTNTETYNTTFNVQTGDATCTCGRYHSRVKPAADLMQTTPNINTSFVCKHIEDVAIQAQLDGVVNTVDLEDTPLVLDMNSIRAGGEPIYAGDSPNTATRNFLTMFDSANQAVSRAVSLGKLPTFD